MASTSLRDNVATGYPDLTTTSNVAAGLPTYQSSVGAVGTSGDNRKFVWSYDGGTALVAGHLYQAPAQNDTSLHDLTCASVAVGDRTVSVTSTASTVTLDELNGGYLTFTGAGGGQTYAIAGNSAATGAAFTITLADPIRVALTTPLADTMVSPYYGVVANPTTATAAPVGAAVVATAGTQYAWLQTTGVIALQNDGASTIAPGDLVAASVTTAGEVTAFLAGTTPAIVGIAMETIEGTQFGFVKLTLN